MSALLTVDWSTINEKALAALPAYTLPASYQLQAGMGGGCFLDAPGYPTYFTRSIYTRHGNNPAKGPQTVIDHPTLGLRVVESTADYGPKDTWDTYRAKIDKRLARLWVKLPLEHPRVQAWINYVAGYFNNCYEDPRIPADKRRNAGTLRTNGFDVPEIIEVTDALGIEIDPAYRARFLAAVAQVDRMQGYTVSVSDWSVEDGNKAWELLHTIEDRCYRPTTYVQEWYPEYQHDRNRPNGYAKGDWWKILAEQPTPDNCPGERHSWGKDGHPVNGNWCQVCGWQQAEE